MKIDISSDAELDIENGYWFYETQSLGVGDYFRSSIFSDIDSRFFRSTSSAFSTTLRFNPPTVPILEYTRFQAKRKLFKLSQTTGKNT